MEAGVCHIERQVVCLFQPADTFNTRYATLGFNDGARLDDGNMWPTPFALTKLTKAEEKKLAEAEAALDDDAEPWNSFVTFLQNIVDADTASLTLRLPGTYTPTDELVADATRSQELNVLLVERTKRAGDLRSDFDVNDLALIIEQIAAIRVGDMERTRQLRRRYLALTLQALHGTGDARLPGHPPTWEEISGRWG